jgi:enoyl-[acyl-carrier-protein] reductase (NADH)
MVVAVTGGSSLSLTYIASERIIPGYVCHALFASLFLFTELSFIIE